MREEEEKKWSQLGKATEEGRGGQTGTNRSVRRRIGRDGMDGWSGGLGPSD